MDYKSLKQAGVAYGSAKTDEERKKALNNMASIAEKMGVEDSKRWTPSNPPTKEDFDSHPAVLRANRMMLKQILRDSFLAGVVLGLAVLAFIIWIRS